MKGGAKKRVMTPAEEETEGTVQSQALAPRPTVCGEKSCKGRQREAQCLAQGEEKQQRSWRRGEGGTPSGKQCLASPEYQPAR